MIFSGAISFTIFFEISSIFKFPFVNCATEYISGKDNEKTCKNYSDLFFISVKYKHLSFRGTGSLNCINTIFLSDDLFLIPGSDSAENLLLRKDMWEPVKIYSTEAEPKPNLG